MAAVLHTQADTTGAVFAHTVRVRGIQLISGTSVTLYPGGDASGDPICIAASVGTVQELPGCGVDATDGLWAVVAGAGVATVFYD